MVFWALVQRELRAAARRKGTFRLRWWSALLASLVGCCAGMICLIGSGRPGLGASLFSSLTACAFFLCCLAGVFLTSDCLSLENREGTLGLLLLTNMTRFDVVMGKLCGAGLNAFYVLLTLFPIAAVPLLLGGVTGSEFWRVALALINALFFSLVAGLFVSAFGREPERVIIAAAVFLLMLVVGLPLLSYLVSLTHLPRVFKWIGWFSPMEPFLSARESTYFAGPREFWFSLCLSHWLAWLLLGWAGWLLPGRVAEPANSRSWRERFHAWAGAAASSASPVERRREWLEVNPLLWLVGERAGLRRILWLTNILWGGGVITAGILSASHLSLAFQNGTGAQFFGFILKSLCAVQACAFFTNARRSGVLEILLTTPISLRGLVDAQITTLKRTFLAPVLTFFGLGFFPGILQLTLLGLSPDFPRMLNGGFAVVVHAVYCLRSIADFYAISLVALWLSLSMRKPGYASGFSILFVLILPTFLCWFDVLADFAFIAWATANLRADLRPVLARQYSAPFDRR